MHHLEDQDIIQLVLQGQQNAFAILVERYQHFVFTITMRYVNEREQAEELSQDIFLKAYRSLNNYKGKSKFSTWLYTIVHTTCLSSLRRKKEALVFIEESRMAASAGSENMDYKLDLRSTKEVLNKAIRQLADTDAEVVYFFTWQSSRWKRSA